MKKVKVSTSSEYDIIIERDILKNCGKYIEDVVNASKFAIITDENVNKFYGDIVENSLKEIGKETCRFVFKAGESSKSEKTLFEIYSFLNDNHITRADCLIALGGGVVGDITGFAAATYLRGLNFIQIPTSLLAQVDSSVGGKTAIDLPCGKNLVGAFKQPKLVLCDANTLNTLPEKFFIDGMGEVVKYGMIRSASLFEKLSSFDLNSVLKIIEDVIFECVSIKRDVVEADEFDKGERMILNFGHTLGHSVEHYYEYTGITHGMAVAVGMARITKCAVDCGIVDSSVYEKLVFLLKKYNLPFDTEPNNSELYKACTTDKKCENKSINFILCREIGKAEIIKKSLDEFYDFIK